MSLISEIVSLILAQIPSIMPVYEIANEAVYGKLYKKLKKVDIALRALRQLAIDGKYTWASLMEANPIHHQEHDDLCRCFLKMELTLDNILIIEQDKYDHGDTTVGQRNISKLLKDHGDTEDLRKLFAGYKLLVDDFIEQAELMPSRPGRTYERGVSAQLRQCSAISYEEIPLFGTLTVPPARPPYAAR